MPRARATSRSPADAEPLTRTPHRHAPIRSRTTLRRIPFCAAPAHALRTQRILASKLLREPGAAPAASLRIACARYSFTVPRGFASYPVGRVVPVVRRALHHPKSLSAPPPGATRREGRRVMKKLVQATCKSSASNVSSHLQVRCMRRASISSAEADHRREARTAAAWPRLTGAADGVRPIKEF